MPSLPFHGVLVPAYPYSGDLIAYGRSLSVRIVDVKARASEPTPLVTERWLWRVFFPVYDRTPQFYPG